MLTIEFVIKHESVSVSRTLCLPLLWNCPLEKYLNAIPFTDPDDSK